MVFIAHFGESHIIGWFLLLQICSGLKWLLWSLACLIPCILCFFLLGWRNLVNLVGFNNASIRNFLFIYIFCTMVKKQNYFELFTFCLKKLSCIIKYFNLGGNCSTYSFKHKLNSILIQIQIKYLFIQNKYSYFFHGWIT